MILRRPGLILVLGLGLLASSPAGETQQAGKTYRIGWLAPGPNPSHLEALRDGLRALGYVEGKNLVIEQRSADGKSERLDRLAAEFALLKVDVIVTDGTAAARAAAKSVGSTPVVFVSGDPVEMGLAASLARPGGRLTGLSIISTELNTKRLELLRETFPKISRVATLYEPRQRKTMIPAIDAAAHSLGLQLSHFEVRGVDDIDRAFGAAASERVGAVMPLPSAFLSAERQRIGSLAARHRLPAMYEQREFPEAGGLMSYGSDLRDVLRRAATYVDKILRGARPADLPVEQPTKFELVVNLKTAKALGLTIPQSILVRADEVIQ
jgi:putative ABC transport system substrate-binding protein